MLSIILCLQPLGASSTPKIVPSKMSLDMAVPRQGQTYSQVRTALQVHWRMGHNVSKVPGTEPGTEGTELMSALSHRGDTS